MLSDVFSGSCDDVQYEYMNQIDTLPPPACDDLSLDVYRKKPFIYLTWNAPFYVIFFSHFGGGGSESVEISTFFNASLIGLDNA